MKNIYKALADFQQEVPIIYKDTQAYSYKYADLPAILSVINPLLKKNGLGFTQLIKGSEIETILFHVESGETLISSISIPENVELKGQNNFQVLGSAITYLRRYSISAMLGLVTDKDTDAQGEQVKKPATPQSIKTANQPATHHTVTEAQITSLKSLLNSGDATKIERAEKSFDVFCKPPYVLDDKIKKEIKELITFIKA